MKIYFIRHGEAEIYAEDDFKRKLTTLGKESWKNRSKPLQIIWKIKILL